MNPFVQNYTPLNPQPTPYPMNLGSMFSQYPMFQQAHKIPRVKGREGANAYQMPPGSEELLLDIDEPIIWMVQTDDAGVKTVNALDVSEHIDAEVKNFESLESRVRKLEEMMRRESNPVDVAFTAE